MKLVIKLSIEFYKERAESLSSSAGDAEKHNGEMVTKLMYLLPLIRIAYEVMKMLIG